MNQSSNNKYYIRVNGQNILVSEQVFRTYHHYRRKEEYFTYDLKKERFSCNQDTKTIVLIPGREDSYERLLELDTQFQADGESPEDIAVKSVMLEHLHQALTMLDEDERAIINELFYMDRTVRQASVDLNIARSTLQDRKIAILKKLRTLLENFS